MTGPADDRRRRILDAVADFLDANLADLAAEPTKDEARCERCRVPIRGSAGGFDPDEDRLWCDACAPEVDLMRGAGGGA